jgi:hypothetical protein
LATIKSDHERRRRLDPTVLASIIGATATIIAALAGALLGNNGVFVNILPGSPAKTVTITPAPVRSPNPTGIASSDPITGDWNVTYGAPATVTLTLAGGMYTELAKTKVLIIPGVSCELQPGTAIATFTRTGPGTYAGNASLWSENTCTIYGTTPMTLALSSDGNRLVASLAHGGGIPQTLVFTRIRGAQR